VLQKTEELGSQEGSVFAGDRKSFAFNISSVAIPTNAALILRKVESLLLRHYSKMSRSRNCGLDRQCVLTGSAIATTTSRNISTARSLNAARQLVQGSWWSHRSHDMPSSLESIPPQHELPQGRAST
jgi:hypothetical protein